MMPLLTSVEAVASARARSTRWLERLEHYYEELRESISAELIAEEG